MDILMAILISMALAVTAIGGTSYAEEKHTEVAAADQQMVSEDQAADKKKKGEEEPECD